MKGIFFSFMNTVPTLIRIEWRFPEALKGLSTGACFWTLYKQNQWLKARDIWRKSYREIRHSCHASNYLLSITAASDFLALMEMLHVSWGSYVERVTPVKATTSRNGTSPVGASTCDGAVFFFRSMRGQGRDNSVTWGVGWPKPSPNSYCQWFGSWLSFIFLADQCNVGQGVKQGLRFFYSS